MIFDTKEQLLEQLKEDGACDEGIAWCKEMSFLNALLNDILERNIEFYRQLKNND